MRMPSPKFPSVTARQGPAKGADRLVSAPAGPNFPGPKFPSVTSRQGPARGADRPVSAPAGEVSESRSATPEPSPAKLGGRTGDQEARQKAVPELQQPLEQRATSDKEASSSVPEAARRQSSARDSQSGVRDSAEQSDWLSDKNQTSKLASSLASSSMSAKPSEQSRSKSSQSVSPTSGSGKTGGRTPPGEQNARQEAMAGLQRKGKQPTALDQQAATIFVDRPQAQPDSDSSSSQADSEQPSRAPAQGQTSSVLPPSGRAPAGEHEAREKAMSELKKQSQQTQPAQSADLQKIRDQAKDQQQGKDQGLGISTQQAAAVYKPQSPGSEQNQPQQQSGWLSDKNQTSKLASSLASSSTSAKPSDRDPSNAQPSSPARTEQSPNRVRDFFAGVQSRLSGRNAQSPGMGFASSTSTAPQTDQPSSPMQVANWA